MMKRNKTIAIVEDSLIDRKLLSSVLERNGYTVIALDNAEACLELLKKEIPDLVLLDILMPNMHGKELLKAIRKKFTAIELPVLMITVMSKATDIIECLEMGANDYLAKPVDFEVALVRINTHLKIMDLSKELVRLREFEIINAMVATYNHEINNPLSIALGSLRNMKDQCDEKNYKTVEGALDRITTIVKQIREVTEKNSIEYEPYVNSAKLVKIK